MFTLIGKLSRASAVLLVLVLSSCMTTFVEFKGECVIQAWDFLGLNMRTRQICDLPPPDADEVQVRDREAMNTNPFPDLIDLGNEADSIDPNLLEKNMGYPQEEK